MQHSSEEKSENLVHRSVPGYQFVSWLGKGGSGVVSLYFNQELQRDEALKFFKTDAPGAATFIRGEVGILADLNHPNVVKVHRMVEAEDGAIGFAMEYISGLNIEQWLQAAFARQASREELLGVFHQCLAGVAYLHKEGIIHLDIKPENLIVDTNGVVKIVDFGIATYRFPEPQQGAFPTAPLQVSTLPWSAPEQVLNLPSGSQFTVDVYAMGLLLRRILVGSWLVDPTLPEKQMRESVVRPSAAFPLAKVEHRKLPKDLKIITEKALRWTPTERYDDANSFLRDFENFKLQRPITALPRGLFYHFRLFCSRNAWPVGFAAAVLILLPSVAIWNKLQERKRERQAMAWKLDKAQQQRNFLREMRFRLRDLDYLPQSRVELAGWAETFDSLHSVQELSTLYAEASFADLQAAVAEKNLDWAPAQKLQAKALDAYSKLIEKHPSAPLLYESAVARYSYARILRERLLRDDAEEHLKKALKLAESIPTVKMDTEQLVIQLKSCIYEQMVANLRKLEKWKEAHLTALRRVEMLATPALPAGLVTSTDHSCELVTAMMDAVRDFAAFTPDIPENFQTLLEHTHLRVAELEGMTKLQTVAACEAFQLLLDAKSGNFQRTTASLEAKLQELLKGKDALNPKLESFVTQLLWCGVSYLSDKQIYCVNHNLALDFEPGLLSKGVSILRERNDLNADLLIIRGILSNITCRNLVQSNNNPELQQKANRVAYLNLHPRHLRQPTHSTVALADHETLTLHLRLNSTNPNDPELLKPLRKIDTAINEQKHSGAPGWLWRRHLWLATLNAPQHSVPAP